MAWSAQMTSVVRTVRAVLFTCCPPPLQRAPSAWCDGIFGMFLDRGACLCPHIAGSGADAGGRCAGFDALLHACGRCELPAALQASSCVSDDCTEFAFDASPTRDNGICHTLMPSHDRATLKTKPASDHVAGATLPPCGTYEGVPHDASINGQCLLPDGEARPNALFTPLSTLSSRSHGSRLPPLLIVPMCSVPLLSTNISVGQAAWPVSVNSTDLGVGDSDGGVRRSVPRPDTLSAGGCRC